VKQKRRRFLKIVSVLAGAGAVGAWWASTSQWRSARWLRTIVADSRRRVAPAPVIPRPGDWPENAITICWIGHATVLMNFYGVTILTDPAFASRIGVPIGIGIAGPKRFVAPALKLMELPPIDLLLLSHAHMDHIDEWTLGRLKAGATITAKLTGDILQSTGIKQSTEVGWGERTIVRTKNGELEIEAFEVKHWGQRWPSKLERGYNGYILRREGKAVLFGGDTAMTNLFADLKSKGPFEAAIMPIGAYQPWIRNHCTPEQAVDMVNAAGARYIVPVHHLTFKLSDEPFSEPMERLEAALAREPQRIAVKRVGETFQVPP
jgi:L-ascorbate metabolism protein UlaG (beta-lactamase superfamily)